MINNRKVLIGNQRRSALWRLLATSVFVLSIAVTILFSMFNGYKTSGADIVELQNQYELNVEKREAKRKKIENRIADLKKKTKDCEDNQLIGKRMEELEAEIAAKKDELEDLNTELDRCLGQVAAAASAN